MQKIKNYLKIILLLIIINVVGIINVDAATNPYSQTGPYGTNCTWYAWKMAKEKGGVTLPGWGNAKDWYNDAKNAGYTVGTSPKANSIIVWGGWTSYGHVGYVESVEGNVLHVWDSTGPCIDREDEEYRQCIANGVSEETDKICNANAKRIACEYTIDPDYYGITGYIYLDYAPKKTTPSTSTNTNKNTNTSPKKEESSTNVVVTKSSNSNLSNITLSTGTIEFNKDVLEYNIEVENEIETITLNATAEDSKSTIKGTGDYELTVGLNEIKLTVTAEDSSTKEYIIKVTRKEKIEVKPEENIDTNEKEEIITKKDNQQTIILVSITSLLIICIFCLILILNKKQHNKKKK